MKIKDIPKTERPRERLIEYGKENLSNEELLSIILKSGNSKQSVKDISINILKEVNSLENLKDVTKEQLQNIKGIGQAQALTLLSVIELGKRIYLNPKDNKKILLNSSSKIYEYMKIQIFDKKQEYFYCLYVNNKKELIERKLLFMGTVNHSVVHPREIFKHAYLCSASAIICIHNHPSGNVIPSREDICLTNSLVELGQINKIPVIDHIIMGNDNYYSFYEEGKIINL